MDEKLSIKISNIQLFLSFLIVLIHSAAYNVHTNGTELHSIYGLNASTFIQLFFSEGICRIAVPMFFVISGYLLFYNIDKRRSLFSWWVGKLKKRFWSLVLPYLFWSASVYFFFFFAQRLPGLKTYFANSVVGAFGIRGIWENIICNSYNSPLWFCRYLIAFVVVSPILYLAISRLKYVFPLLILLAGALYNPLHLRVDALFFFTIGGTLAISSSYDIVRCFYNRLKRKEFIWGLILIWLTLVLMKTYYLCNCDPNMLLMGLERPGLGWYRLAEICVGLMASWEVYDYLSPKIIDKKISICYLSFFLFVAHHPVAKALIKILSKIFGTTEAASLCVFFLTFVITVIGVGVVGVLARRYIPKTFSILCGGR